MGCLTLLLFWLPVIGPFIAGLVGGVKAGSVKRALLAVFVPGVMIGVMVAVGVTYLTDGAVLGGLSTGLWTRWDRGGGI